MDTIQRIRRQMQLRGWTEYRLAKESGLSPSTIANIFRRNTLPSIPTLEIICKAFGITLSRFFADGESGPALSEEQQTLLRQWTKLPPRKRRALLDLINEMTT